MIERAVLSEPILVVEDEEMVRSLVMRKLARAGYQTVGASNGMEALHLLRERTFGVILSDINMPRLNGLEMLQVVKETWPDIIVVMFTAFGDLSHAISAMKLGASDYLVKPFDLDELVSAVEQAVRKRERTLARKQVENLWNVQTGEGGASNQRLLLSTVMALANTLEAKDPYTVGHSQRVADLSEALARRIGMTDHEAKHIRLAGMLHDIGKIGIREAIMNKAGPLTTEEIVHIQTHPLIGERILLPVTELNGALHVIRHHHERWDGKGYPDGLSGLDIPVGARILALADAYDAVTSERPYRAAAPPSAAVQEIQRCVGGQFDPNLSPLFIELLEDQIFATE